jgi:type VI secretion system protein ImpM
MAHQTTPGWFGKLSMLGDFASRRLDPAWTEACDRWLSASMQSSQQQLGHDWLQTYLSAPVWRFAWAPGVVDSHWWFGVLMPSCDNVGRYFPLVVAQPRPHAPVDRFSLDHLELWWSHVSRAAMQTLSEDARVESFEAELEQAPPWPGAVHAPEVRAMAAPGRERLSVRSGATLEQFLHGLAATALQQRLDGCSLWWPLRGQQDAAACSVLTGLPPAESFSDLLRGSW